jgi:hypothetical protein
MRYVVDIVETITLFVILFDFFQSISPSLYNCQMHNRIPTQYSSSAHDATNVVSFSSDDIQRTSHVHVNEPNDEKIFSVLLPKENSPLGIHVVPASTDEQHVNGLVLQNIEADGRIKRQGILQIHDRIVEINRTNIEHCSFDKYETSNIMCYI